MLQAKNTLLFGRVTYQMMESFWPTDYAREQYPVVARQMEASEKIVFSNSLKGVSWKNTRIIGGDIVAAIKSLKLSGGNNLAILGSGTILTQFAEQGLIDRYEIMIDPVVIAKGTPIFNNLSVDLRLKLVESRVFKSGVVLLCYEPVGV
jgi:dihydrofolate reductase